MVSSEEHCIYKSHPDSFREVEKQSLPVGGCPSARMMYFYNHQAWPVLSSLVLEVILFVSVSLGTKVVRKKKKEKKPTTSSFLFP